MLNKLINIGHRGAQNGGIYFENSWLAFNKAL